MLMQTIPMSSPLYAVLTDEGGKPDFRRVMCLGVIEVPISDEKRDRVVCGYCVGDQVMAADFLPNFVGYSEFIDDAAWAQRCAEKRVAVTAAAEKAKQQKIIVPQGPKPVFADA